MSQIIRKLIKKFHISLSTGLLGHKHRERKSLDQLFVSLKLIFEIEEEVFAK